MRAAAQGNVARIAALCRIALEGTAEICRRRFARLAEQVGRRVSATAPRQVLARLTPYLPNPHSLTTKILIVGIVFALVPVIIYGRLGDAEREKSALLVRGAEEHGKVVAIYLTPLLKKGLKSLPQIDAALRPLANENLNIRILFRPNNAAKDVGFYYVAANPPLSERYLKSEIKKLESLGVLSRLAASCSERETVDTRNSVEGGPQQLITLITPVATAAGCWSIITSYASAEFLGSSFGRPYWQAPEIQFATILYLTAAGFTLFVLLRIRGGLRVFRNTAVATGRHGGTESFARQNRNPDLNDVALEFDRMVQRIGLLSFAVARSPIAVAIANGGWQLEYVNPAYERLSGRPGDDLIGSDLRDKGFDSATDISWSEICRKVARGETWHGQIRRWKPDGRTLWAEVSLYRLVSSTGEAEHFVCLQEDVTERKQMLNNLIAAKDRAESLNQMKSNFVARMSHEFRTPLNAILGFSEMIVDQAFGKCDVPRYVEYAEYIHGSGTHLLSLINDILDLSKLESGKETLTLEPVDLTAVIREATTYISSQASKARVTLRTEDRLDGRRVIADRRAMKQVLLNLLSNGVKFTPVGGEVTVAAAPRQDGRILLTIADTGCGIDKAELPKVCEPYERAGTAYVRNTTGTGLGLPIVKRLVEIQSGEFRIASELGKGTTVDVILRGAPPPSDALSA